MDTLNEPLEFFRDALLQASVFGETGALRASVSAARDDLYPGSIRRVLDAAAGSRYLPRLERYHADLWVPA